MNAAYHGGAGDEEEEVYQPSRIRRSQTHGPGKARRSGRKPTGRQDRRQSAEPKRSDRQAEDHRPMPPLRTADERQGASGTRGELSEKVIAIRTAISQFNRAITYCLMGLPREAMGAANRGIGILELQALKPKSKAREGFITECSCCEKRRQCYVLASSKGPYSEAVCKWCVEHWEQGPCPMKRKAPGREKKKKGRGGT